jgi:hypothetical protein
MALWAVLAYRAKLPIGFSAMILPEADGRNDEPMLWASPVQIGPLSPRKARQFGQTAATSGTR